MYPYVRIHANKISRGKDFILDESQPTEKPDRRIQKIEIKPRLEAENWRHKSGSERWVGDVGERKQKKNYLDL
jgi:hypothetical protein